MMFESVGCAATVWIAPTTSLLGVMFSTCPFRFGPGPWAVHVPPTALVIEKNWRSEGAFRYASRYAALLSSSKFASPAASAASASASASASDDKRVGPEGASPLLTARPCTRRGALIAPKSEQPGLAQL